MHCNISQYFAPVWHKALRISTTTKIVLLQRGDGPIVLVLAPTRELACQIQVIIHVIILIIMLIISFAIIVFIWSKNLQI